jgi:YD repeat-containing protein
VLARVTEYADRWWVEMLRASDAALLAEVGVPLVPSQAVSRSSYGYTWTPSGRFVVQTDLDRGRAVAISVDGTTEEVGEPGCWYPPTTSSEDNAAGEHALGEVSIDASETFGCQG